nr:immunoglobulin heavy chain junction region [Mus musculus]MBK4183696.1 immunoglobulin heavy chain junction region [Mus musculus]
CARGLWDGDYW